MATFGRQRDESVVFLPLCPQTPKEPKSPDRYPTIASKPAVLLTCALHEIDNDTRGDDMHDDETKTMTVAAAATPTARRSFIAVLGAGLAAAFGAAATLAADKQPAAAETNAALEKKIADLAHQLGRLEDTHAIRCLQHQYGFYLDKCLYQEVVDLFADDAEVHFNGGIYRGKNTGVKRLYIGTFQKTFTAGKNGPLPGFLLDHPTLQDVVDVAPDRKTAKARFRCLMQAGVHESSHAPMAEAARARSGKFAQWWEGGIYENQYVRDGAVWKFKVLSYNPIWHADFETGWAHTRPNYVPAADSTFPQNPLGPDELIKRPLWPDTDVVPFHYPHPVTGKVWSA